MLGLEGVLGNLGADKGLANYDRSNTLETILKDVVNLDKDVLSSITVLVYNLPIVGKTLGPSTSSIYTCVTTRLPVVLQLSIKLNASWILFSTPWRTLPMVS